MQRPSPRAFCVCHRGTRQLGHLTAADGLTGSSQEHNLQVAGVGLSSVAHAHFKMEVARQAGAGQQVSGAFGNPRCCNPRNQDSGLQGEVSLCELQAQWGTAGGGEGSAPIQIDS